jgi:hypothetical protein
MSKASIGADPGTLEEAEPQQVPQIKRLQKHGQTAFSKFCEKVR